MTKVNTLTEIDEVVDNDLFYVWDASTPGAPDKRVPGSKMRPPGNKVTRFTRAAGNITIPNLAAGVEADATFTVTNAAVGDSLIFNLTAALPANIAILHAWISAANTATVRFRNTHASNAFSTADVAAVALAIRTV